MRNTLLSLILALAVALATFAATRVRIVHVERFCTGPKQWRVTFAPPDIANLGLTSGVYKASSYSLTNGFGLRRPADSWLTVPFPKNASGLTIRFEP